tara:strand:- start:176 stop:352 length:177 start_codon:yes stop_codon:yes gene_type:complete
MINKVSKEECLDAIDYFWSSGFIEELTTDKKYYLTILLKKVANTYNIKLHENKEEALR